MPDYYIAEDGTIHDREAEHRSRTQHTAAPAVADTTAEDTPEVSFTRQFVYWLFAVSASVFAAVCVFHEMQAAFTPPAHLDFLEDYVQQFVFAHAKALANERCQALTRDASATRRGLLRHDEQHGHDGKHPEHLVAIAGARAGIRGDAAGVITRKRRQQAGSHGAKNGGNG